MYKITTQQLNDLISHSYGNKDALSILRDIKNTNRTKKKAKPHKKNEDKLKASSEKIRANLIKNQTPQEVIFKALLKSCGIDYEFQKVFILTDPLAKSFYVADFYIPKLNIIFEIDGYYHYQAKGKGDDKNRDRIFKKELEIDTYRFSNSETTDKIKCIEKIEKILSKYYTLLE